MKSTGARCHMSGTVESAFRDKLQLLYHPRLAKVEKGFE